MAYASAGGRQPEPRDESPGEHLDRLLARSVNALQLDTTVVQRLRTALLHHSEPQAMRSRKTPHRPLRCLLLKHAYLLPNGDSQVLWELEHNTGPDEDTVHEVYSARDGLAWADIRLSEWFDGPGLLAPDPEVGFPGHGLRDGFSFFGLDPALGPDLEFGPVSEPEPGEGLPGPPLDSWITLMAGAVPLPRTYIQDRSAEHARRVLRRSENEDRPGEEIWHLLGSALAHETVFVTRFCGWVDDRLVEWSLFEHAFLLADGGELSLWELEHNLTPDGRLVCEAYLGEEAARSSMARRGRAL